MVKESFLLLKYTRPTFENGTPVQVEGNAGVIEEVIG